MATPALIYCAGGNIRFAEIAINAGFLYGAQVPDTVYFYPYFVDNDFKRPNLDRYVAEVKKYRPCIATVVDWMRRDQLTEVLAWGESVAPFVEIIVVIPKVPGCINEIPRKIGGTPVRLGYSVPTSYGGTLCHYSEFDSWPVHILGGSPQQARRLTRYLNVVSVDGNMCQLMANQYNAFFDPWKRTRRGYWPTLQDVDGKKWGDGSDKADAPYEAFRRSCEGIMSMWRGKRNALFQIEFDW